MADKLHMTIHLLSSLDEWEKMVGDDENRELQVTHSRESGLDVTSPKHGKVIIALWKKFCPLVWLCTGG